MSNPHVIVKARDVELVVNGEPLQAGHGREIPMAEPDAAVTIARADCLEGCTSENVVAALRLAHSEPDPDRTETVMLYGNDVGPVIACSPRDRTFTLTLPEDPSWALDDRVVDTPDGCGYTAGEHRARSIYEMLGQFLGQFVSPPGANEAVGKAAPEERRARDGSLTDRDGYDPELKVGWPARESDGDPNAQKAAGTTEE